MRKTPKEINEICKKFHTNILWSWSRYNIFKTDPYSYFLKYIKGENEDRRDSIYCVSGGYCHDILEKYYNGEIQQSDMINEYEDSLFTMNLAEYKYDRSDEDKNSAIAEKYESCIKHFFRNHTKPDNLKMLLEMFCVIKVKDDIIFQGYIDNCGMYKDENGEKRIVITDYKTSTIYKGEKLEKESGQLYLYAEGIRQRTNLPLDHISIRYLFLKYVNIKCLQANGTWKERQIERNQIGSKLYTTAKMWLGKLGYGDGEFIKDNYLDEMLMLNSIDNLPDDVKDKMIISDCYVYLPLAQENIDNLKSDIIDTVNEINSKTKGYKEANDDHIFWSDINEKNEYYYAVLSGYSRALHKPYNEYLENKEMFQNKDNEDELTQELKDLGLI
jgi:hypothetical protein|nr:MAG TPA: PD-(D/E)XK nuclease superfamily protein [Caudoviricetes sp.]